MGKHSKAEDLGTSISEPRLVELRLEGKAVESQCQFVDPTLLSRCEAVLERRGEEWAASVLGRDISRRSLGRPALPYLLTGESHALVAADAEEDQIAIAALDPDLTRGM